MMQFKKIFAVAVCAASIFNVVFAEDMQKNVEEESTNQESAQSSVSILSGKDSTADIDGKINVIDPAHQSEQVRAFLAKYYEALRGSKYKGEITIPDDANIDSVSFINDMVFGCDANVSWKGETGEWNSLVKAHDVSSRYDENGHFLRRYHKNADFFDKSGEMIGMTEFWVAQKDDYNVVRGDAHYQQPKSKDNKSHFVYLKTYGNATFDANTNAQSYVVEGKARTAVYFNNSDRNKRYDEIFKTIGYYSVTDNKVIGQFLLVDEATKNVKIIDVDYTGMSPNLMNDAALLLQRVQKEGIKTSANAQSQNALYEMSQKNSETKNLLDREYETMYYDVTNEKPPVYR